MSTEPNPSHPAHPAHPEHHFRFHLPHLHLGSAFGDDWLALKAEAFARFFGTPVFLLAQTLFLEDWITLNVSLQAAYAAPLILLAQTRQADRDKAHAVADAQHREALASAAAQRQELAAEQTAQLLVLVEQNTRLTELAKQLSQRIEALTIELHGKLCKGPQAG